MEEQNKRSIGTKYENMATEYLKNKGYKIIERNYRNKFGEIDIIAEDTDGVLVYIEIKYRSSKKCGDPLEAVDYRKQKRISKIAFYHYAGNGYNEEKACRFDVIAIYGDDSIKHIENAFNYVG